MKFTGTIDGVFSDESDDSKELYLKLREQFPKAVIKVYEGRDLN